MDRLQFISLWAYWLHNKSFRFKSFTVSNCLWLRYRVEERFYSFGTIKSSIPFNRIDERKFTASGTISWYQNSRSIFASYNGWAFDRNDSGHRKIFDWNWLNKSHRMSLANVAVDDDFYQSPTDEWESHRRREIACGFATLPKKGNGSTWAAGETATTIATTAPILLRLRWSSGTGGKNLRDDSLHICILAEESTAHSHIDFDYFDWE